MPDGKAAAPSSRTCGSAGITVSTDLGHRCSVRSRRVGATVWKERNRGGPSSFTLNQHPPLRTFRLTYRNLLSFVLQACEPRAERARHLRLGSDCQGELCRHARLLRGQLPSSPRPSYSAPRIASASRRPSVQHCIAFANVGTWGAPVFLWRSSGLEGASGSITHLLHLHMPD